MGAYLFQILLSPITSPNSLARALPLSRSREHLPIYFVHFPYPRLLRNTLYAMFTLNANAPSFVPSNPVHQQMVRPIFNSGVPSCVLILDSDEYRSEFLMNTFNREAVADEDL